MRVGSSLYRAILRQADVLFARQGLPLTGVVGLQLPPPCLAPLQAIADALRGAGRAEDAFLALRILPRQATVLAACEEETREAMAEWRQLQLALAPGLRPARPPVSQVAAAQAAAELLASLTRQREAARSLLLEEEAGEGEGGAAGEAAGAEATLEAMAAQARQVLAADSAAATAAASSDSSGADSRAWAQAICQAAFRSAGGWRAAFKAGEPVEWVYDGLAPALLAGALAGRKGTPLIVALATCLVAQRLGLHSAWLVCAHDAELPGTASGPVVLQDLPPELAARQAGRTIAAPPAPNTWLAAVRARPGAPPAFIDVTPRGGRVLDSAQLAAAYPQAGAEGGGGGDAYGAAALAVWVDMARTMVLAHQRRGESDDVAHWMYCLLALDPGAAEWAHALPAAAGGADAAGGAA